MTTPDGRPGSGGGGRSDSGTLSRAELQALKRWERRMIVALVGCLFVLAAVTALGLLLRPSGEIAWLLVALLFGSAAVGGAVQFSERCPRCGVRIGWQTRLLLPARCARCGVGFRPGESDSPAIRSEGPDGG